MAPKQDKSNKKDTKANDKKKGKGKDKKIVPRKTCRGPIPTGTIMAQRVLPPTVCCPPSGCSPTGCLPGPGCGRC